MWATWGNRERAHGNYGEISHSSGERLNSWCQFGTHSPRNERRNWQNKISQGANIDYKEKKPVTDPWGTPTTGSREELLAEETGRMEGHWWGENQRECFPRKQGRTDFQDGDNHLQYQADEWKIYKKAHGCGDLQVLSELGEDNFSRSCRQMPEVTRVVLLEKFVSEMDLDGSRSLSEDGF